MSQPASASRRMPLLGAAVGALLVAALVLAFVHVRSVSREHNRQAQIGYALTADQQAAVTAAATEAVNLVSFSRKTFDADFARALNGATGGLKSDFSTKKALTLSTLTNGKLDLKGTVGSAAFVGPADTGSGVLVLVTVNAFVVADSSTGSSNKVQRLVITMLKIGKSWLAADLTAVGLSG